jgi:hypothetical protein
MFNSNTTADPRAVAFAEYLEEQPSQMSHVMKMIELRTAPRFKAAGASFTLNGTSHGTSTAGSAVTTCYADIQSERTDWTWDGRMPRKALSLVVGTEGLGKTAVEIRLAALATLGKLPGCFSGEPVNVALLTPEDDPRMTIKPRLEAAGADVTRVFDVKMRKDEFDTGVSLPDDTDAIRQELVAKEIRIMIADPLAAMLDPKRNSWKDTDVRGALEPMVAVCAEHDITWIGTLHTNKTNSTDARQRGMGTVGWRQVCRASFIVGLDPDDSTGADGSARCIAHDKHNLGPWTPTKRFKLDTVDVSIQGVTAPIVTATIGEDCDVSASQMLAAEQGFENPADRKADVALTWLRHKLEDGPRAVKALKQDAEEAGHSWRTIERAKRELGAKAAQGPHGWTWQLVETIPF